MRTYRPCPTCDGIGRIASAELVGLRLLRLIETRATEGFSGTARIELHPELADALQNGRRTEIAELEREFDLRVEVIASPSLHRSEEIMDWQTGKTNGERSARAKKGETATIGDSAAKRPASRSRRRRSSKKSTPQRRSMSSEERQQPAKDVKPRPTPKATQDDKSASSETKETRSGDRRRRRSRRSRKPRSSTPKPATKD